MCGPKQVSQGRGTTASGLFRSGWGILAGPLPSACSCLGTRARPRARPCAAFACLFVECFLRLNWLILSHVNPPLTTFTRRPSCHGQGTPSPRQPFFVGRQAHVHPTPARHHEHESPAPCPAASPPRPAGSLLCLGHGNPPPRMRALLCQHGPTTQGQHPRDPDKPGHQQQRLCSHHRPLLRRTHYLLQLETEDTRHRHTSPTTATSNTIASHLCRAFCCRPPPSP